MRRVWKKCLLAADTNVDTATDHDTGGDGWPEEKPHDGPLGLVVYDYKLGELGIVVTIKWNSKIKLIVYIKQNEQKKLFIVSIKKGVN